MKKYVVFEDSVFKRRLERKLYSFCLRRQISLIRFLPVFLLYNIMRSFAVVGKEKYLAKRYSFLACVNDLDKMLKAFFEKNKKRMLVPDSAVVIVSEHPAEVLGAVRLEDEHEIIANSYDTENKKFVSFSRANALVPSDEYMAYGTLLSPIMKKAAVPVYLFGKRMIRSKVLCIFLNVINYIFTYLFMLASSVATGYAALFWASRACENADEMYESYFEIPMLVGLNIAPVAALCLLCYFLFNSSAAAVFVSSGITMVLSWANYYKLLFRNDPVLFGDLGILMEARMMTDQYEIVIDGKMIEAMCIIALVSVFLAIHLNAKTKPRSVRFVAVAALIVAMCVGYSNVYASSEIYSSTQNLSLINRWSSTQQFLSRGFVYPFIYSAKSSVDKAPKGYSKGAAKDALEEYTYENIPEDKKVNIIGIMLEAFGDFGKFEDLEFSCDPYERFREVCGESYSGTLINDIFAGGTVTTERSFITGFNEHASYRKATNSYAWYFREQGYTVEGSHPCYDWFYNRANINPQLGFERYYFDDDTYMALNNGERLCHDDVLFANIVKLFRDATENGDKYFSFNVTYQGHGPYSSEPSFEKEYLVNKGYSEESYNTINNYFAMIDDVSSSVYNMIEEMKAESEPVVVIMFGDHMPWMGNNNSIYEELQINLDISTDEGFVNYYETPYFIWANEQAKAVLGNDFT